MAVNYSAINNIGWPAGADQLIFSGTSSTGIYSYGSSLAAGTYAVVGSSAGLSSGIGVSTASNGNVLAANNTPVYFTLSTTEASFRVTSSFSTLGTNASSTGAITFYGAGYLSGNGAYVAGQYNGSNGGASYPYVSFDGGYTFSSSSYTSFPYYLNGVLTAGNSVYMYGNQSGTGAYGTTISVSTNGTTWTSAYAPGTGQTISGMDYAASATNKYVAVGYDGSNGIIRYSTNAVTWNAATNPFTTTTQQIQIVVWNPVTSKWVCAASSEVAQSTDGVTWTNKTTLSGIVQFGYNGSNGLYIAAASNNGIYTSTDAVTWTQRRSDLGGASTTRGIAWTGSLNLFARANQVWSSTDGTTWTYIPSAPTGSNYYGVTMANGRAYLGGSNLYGTGLQALTPGYFSLYKCSTVTALN